MVFFFVFSFLFILRGLEGEVKLWKIFLLNQGTLQRNEETEGRQGADALDYCFCEFECPFCPRCMCMLQLLVVLTFVRGFQRSQERGASDLFVTLVR